MARQVLDSPIGPLLISAGDAGVFGVRFGAGAAGVGETSADGDGDSPMLGAAVAELRAYFQGALVEFTVPVEIRGGSEFERAVWGQLRRIPYGEMRTYGEIAAAVGDRAAARAVGVACNRNPVPVIVPCHRVVGAGGKLVGFGGGLPRKRHLLELEARVALQRAWA